MLDTMTVPCHLCGKPAKRIVKHISRRSRQVTSEWPVCDEHAQAELTLATSGLSMVDIDLIPLSPTA